MVYKVPWFFVRSNLCKEALMSAAPVPVSPQVFSCFELEEAELCLILRMKAGPVLSSDTAGYAALQADVRNACRLFRQPRIVVNFSAIDNMVVDAFGIFDIPRRLRRTVVLCGLNPELHEKLRLAGFDSFQVVGRLEEAMA